MLRSTACKQLTHAAAILALALLCAQTLVVVHDHQISDSELCAVCSTPTEQAPGPSLAAAVDIRTEASPEPLLVPAAPLAGIPALNQARAPPIA